MVNSYALSYMVIDGDILSNVLLRKTLEIYYPNSKVYFFSDTIKALRYLSDSKNLIPDVIVLDIQVSDMDSYCFLSQYQYLKFPKEIPIFTFSAFIDELDLKKNYASIIKKHFEKPLTIDKINEIIYNIPVQ
ncbi:MAG: response regulator [Raineya sp.]|jgi:response regulator RpfG family c-di-GMP phosphodiesterase|nr:response regulator [Raineya sp.]